MNEWQKQVVFQALIERMKNAPYDGTLTIYEDANHFVDTAIEICKAINDDCTEVP